MQDYCTTKEGFDAKCQGHQVVVMGSAKYGRMSLGRCVDVDFGYLGCSEDVLDIFDGACSGLHNCEIPHVGALLRDVSPCPSALTSYLEAAYWCQDGEMIACCY